MNPEMVRVRCGCGALIETDMGRYILSGNTCPACGYLITSNIHLKKDGFALFIRRTKTKSYRPTLWKEVEP